MKNHKNNAELFADARRSLLGNLSTAVWSFLLCLSFSILLNQLGTSFSFSSPVFTLAFRLAAAFVTSLFGSLIGVGLTSVFLKLQYGQPAGIANLLAAFSENSDKAVKVRFFVTLGEFLCLLPVQLLLYFIPAQSLFRHLPLLATAGILCCAGFVRWAMTYAMVNYLLLDFPSMEASEILRISRKMMQGNRIRLFLLLLRLLPLHLLGLFSLGLANIWAGVCQHACCAAFYKDMMQA